MMNAWRTSVCAGLGLAVVAAMAITGRAQAPRSTRSPVPEFIPDYTFTGAQLTGWHTMGDADWRAENGVIIGTPRPGGSGGWLVFDKSYQDVSFYSRFRCQSPCKTGVMLRAEQSAAGLKGLFVSVADGDLASYKVALDPSGKELSREKLVAGGGQARSIAPANAAAAPGALGGGPAGAPGGGRAGAPGGGRAGGGPAGPGGRAAGPGGGRQMNLPVPLPALDPPAPGIHAGEWNQLGVNLDSNVLRPYLNTTNEIGFSNTADEGNGYGVVALYAGGTGETRFETVSFKDLNIRPNPAETTSSRFRMQRLESFYYSWGVGVADIDRDGNLDVVAGPWIHYGPTFTTKREFYLGQTFSPSNTYASNMVTYAVDVTGDGWPDVLATTEGRGLTLYVNPKGQNRRWDKYPGVVPATTEIIAMKDIDGDGVHEAIMGSVGAIAYAKPDPANLTGPWIVTPVSETGMAYGHGIGAGDINGDGRMDILATAGWWEQPATKSAVPWKYHAQAFGRFSRSEGPGGGDIQVYDINGDKLNDVISSLHSHGMGIAWWEQKRAANGDISFVQHMVMDNFSTENAGNVMFTELHAQTTADIDGDGIPDFITGKRFWAHQESFTDVDPMGPAVLYWYRTVRDPKAPGGARFVPELIHNKSGVGSQFSTADLNKDGAVDIITSTKLGTFIFWGTKTPAAR